MNRLSLANSLIVECGAGNVVLTTTLNQTGEAARMIGWLDAGWSEIQTAHDDWEWMRSSVILGAGVSFVPASGGFNAQFGTNPGQLGITIDEFGGKWVQDSFRNYVTTTGITSEIFMDRLDYDIWRDGYFYGALRNAKTRPVVISVAPDKSLCFGPPSDGSYTITGDFYLSPTPMVQDSDTPLGLPTQYHMLIVYRAMKKYAMYEAAPEVMQRAEMEYDRMFRELDSNYGPKVRMGGALA